jgi:hypothetical protein
MSEGIKFVRTDQYRRWAVWAGRDVATIASPMPTNPKWRVALMMPKIGTVRDFENETDALEWATSAFPEHLVCC